LVWFGLVGSVLALVWSCGKTNQSLLVWSCGKTNQSLLVFLMNMLKPGDTIIIRYINKTRLDWDQAIKDFSDMFDPAELNKARMNEICDILLCERCAGVTDTIHNLAEVGLHQC
jgi:hypothetical protein